MTNFLKQSSVYTVRLGSFISLLDGITPIASTDSVVLANCEEAEILKGDLAPVTVAMAGQLSIITSCEGWYDYVLSATDTDTVGPLTVVVQSVATCLPYFKDFQVVEEAVYDTMYLAAATGPLQGTTGGNKLDVTATGAAGIDWGNMENKTTENDLSATTIKGVTNQNDISAADVNTQVSDVMKTDTNSTDGLTALPPEAPNMEDAIGYLYKAFRNKMTTTATQLNVYDDAGTTIDHKATLSESGGVTTKLEIVAGP